MSARKPHHSELDADLVDPRFGGGQTPEPAPVARPSQPNANVLVGGGEREARAYVGPTALPSAHVPSPSDAGGKVAIASSVDPRRMPTVRIAPGRPRPPLQPGERPAAPEGMGMGMTPFVPGVRPAPPPGFIEPAPRSAPISRPIGSAPAVASSGTPAAVWILAVLLAALVGAGVALYIRRNSATAPVPVPRPAAPATTPAAR